MLKQRPQGPGLYSTIAPPHPRDDLRATHKHGDPLPAVTAAQVQRELDRRLAAPAAVRDVALAYMALAATMPEGKA